MFRYRQERDAIMPSDKGVNDCPFCDKEHMEATSPILWSNTYRYIVYNLYPCGGPERGKKHLLLIPHTHIQYTHELDVDHRQAKQAAEQWIFDYFVGEQFFSFIKHTDGIKSLQHIHYHYIAGTITFESIQEDVLQWDVHNSL